MQSIRKKSVGDTTVKLRGEVTSLLDEICSVEERTRASEVVFLVRQRAQQLGIGNTSGKGSTKTYEKEVIA